MKKYLPLLLLPGLLVACGKSFLDINTDPNNPTAADLSLTLPAAQVGYVSALLRNVNSATGALVDQVHSPTWGRYLQANNDFSNDWRGLYADAFQDLEVVIEATKTSQKGYSGIAKLQKAYLYAVLVDLWGEVPFGEALKNRTPKFDDGKTVYDAVFKLIDEALADLDGKNGAVGTVPATADAIYRGNLTKWVKMGNSLKLRLYNQTRLTDPAAAEAGIKTLLQTPAKLITSTDDDFQFQFGTGIAPQNAHPLWIQNYTASTKSGYLANHLFWKLLNADHPLLRPAVRYKAQDPRLRYYVFRQVASQPATSANIPCTYNNVACNFFYPGNGYLGRDRGDFSVIPADIPVRATYGVYPVGGLFDQDRPRAVTVNDGRGQGVYPMITAFGQLFTRAEAALTLNTGEVPKTLLEAGIRASVKKVMDFGAAQDATIPPGLVPTATDVDAYVKAVLANYDAADAAGKLEIIVDQSWMAHFGNGIESYNALRRTGYPVLPPPVDNGAVGDYPLRLVLPLDETAANPNAPTGNLVNKAVFWDK